jgi:cell division transport system permease protein
MNVKRKSSRPPAGILRSLHVWSGQHARAFVFSIGNLFKNPVGNLFSIAVIGVALALPAGFYLVLSNTDRLIESWEGNIQIALYLKPEVGDQRINDLKQELERQDNIISVSLITRDQALQEYKALSGFSEALDALEENPLPSMLLIQPQLESISGQQGEALLRQFADIPEVDSAQLDRQWVKRLIVILDILERVVVVLSTLLSIAVLLIIGNTIRLSIINKRTEIEINKLFGATNAFIQRPFLYSGLIFGIFGSLLSWLLLFLSTLFLQAPVSELAALYNSDFSLQGLTYMELLILLGAGGGLGLLGSRIAVGRHLKEIEPL